MTSKAASRQQVAVSQIASLTLLNALVFQDVLAASDKRVEPLLRTEQKPDLVSALADHWEYILRQINYYPIFHVAREILLGLPSSADVERGLLFLADRARNVVRLRAAFRHDLMGRVYHTLLADRKYLATYYTSVSAATLLLKLALRPGRWPGVGWADLEGIRQMRIGDLACGTGTLLMAAAEVIGDNYAAASALAGVRPDFAGLHRVLVEDVIYGYEVLPSAAHLTASTLALRAPAIDFRRMHLYSLPHGGPGGRLGSIEYLETFDIATEDIFGAGGKLEQVSPMAGPVQEGARLPNLDLCVMNPPFTRSVGGNLLFGSVPERERAEMQRRLAKILRHKKVDASSTAGLGSVFAAVADRHIKAGGRLALVLPKALLSGVAWGRTRELIGRSYVLEALVVSHDPRPDPQRGTSGHWNFSDNTDLSEVLVLARKLEGEPTPETDASPVLCVNLWRNPSNSWEALGVARALTRGQAPDLESGQGALAIGEGEAQAGEAVTMPWGRLRHGAWMLPCAFARAEVTRSAVALVAGHLRLPTLSSAVTLPLVPLGNLGQLGPDRRDVYDGFSKGPGVTPYPAFWGHDSPLVTAIAQRPNSYLSALPAALPRRPLRKAVDLWPRAGSLLLAERLWLKTQRLAAVQLDQPVLSNVWWPVKLYNPGQEQVKGLALWLNSTLGLLILLGNREETRGAWMDFKKPVLASMPVLDVNSLSVAQLRALAQAYDYLCSQELLPFPHMDRDPVRRQIDQAISQALGLPDLSVLREMLAREPVVCLRPLP